MPETKYKRPFKIKKVQEYSGDVPQMSSPYPEVGYWLDRYAVVDAEDQELARFIEKADAQAVADAMNRVKEKSTVRQCTEGQTR